MKKILVCEDEASIRSFVVVNLRRAGYTVVEAACGEEALTRAQTDGDIAVALLDVMMPGIDGFEVIRRLRADPATADIRIVILSALNSNEDVVKGFNLGANDFIMKPIIMEKLLSCVVTQLQLVEAKGAK